MTAVLTDEDVVLDQLADVRPQCTFRESSDAPQCASDAEWVVFESCGCRPLYCEKHLAFMREFFDVGTIYGESVIECLEHQTRTWMISWERL